MDVERRDILHSDEQAGAARTGDEPLSCAAYFEGEQIKRLLSLLRQSIEEGRGVLIDTSQVKRASTLGLQVLASARCSANARGRSFELRDPSPEFLRACSETGLMDALGVVR